MSEDRAEYDARAEFEIPDDPAHRALFEMAFQIGQVVNLADDGQLDPNMVIYCIGMAMADLFDIIQRQQPHKFEEVIEKADNPLYSAAPPPSTRH